MSSKWASYEFLSCWFCDFVELQLLVFSDFSAYHSYRQGSPVGTGFYMEESTEKAQSIVRIQEWQKSSNEHHSS